MPARSTPPSKGPEAAGVPFEEIKLVHANDRLEALLGGNTEAAALMEPLVSRDISAGARKIADLRWRGGIVAGNDVDEETAAKLRRALNRVTWPGMRCPAHTKCPRRTPRTDSQAGLDLVEGEQRTVAVQQVLETRRDSRRPAG